MTDEYTYEYDAYLKVNSEPQNENKHDKNTNDSKLGMLAWLWEYTH